jgi:hypothetical protein
MLNYDDEEVVADAHVNLDGNAVWIVVGLTLDVLFGAPCCVLVASVEASRFRLSSTPHCHG